MPFSFQLLPITYQLTTGLSDIYMNTIRPKMKAHLPQLVRFLAVHALIGFAFAGAFTFGLIKLNPGNIGTLLANAEGYPLPTIILWFMLGLTSSSCQMGAAIMLLGETPDDTGSGGAYVGMLAPWPAPNQ
jgi:hypothetical protein